MASIKQQTINSSKWNFIERVSTQGIQFFLGIIMARLLVPADFGIIGILAIFFTISQTIIDSGFNAALIRKKDVSEKDLSTVFFFNISVSVIAYATLFFTAPWIADFFGIPIIKNVLRVQSVILIINAIVAVQVAILNIKLDFRSLAKRNVAATLISGCSGVSLAYLGFGVWALVYQQIIAAVVNLIIICFICRWYPKTWISKSSFKSLGSFGSKLLISSLIHTFYVNLTTIVI